MGYGYRSHGEPPVEATCRQCGQTFTRFASQVRHRGPAKFCSTVCQVAYKRRRPRWRECKHCGERFDLSQRDERDPSRGKFCSRICYIDHRRADRSRRISLTCAQCGDTFERPAAWVRKGSANTYCSDACARLARRRGARLPNRGVAWRELAERIRERDENCCVRCGQPEPSTKRLNVDHIVPARLLLDAPEIADDPGNLASLCTACHAIKTHRYEPRILRGDWLAIEEFYDAETRERVTALISAVTIVLEQ
jgi:5-methylcytosine-specific restriction endonuclease McrA